MKISARSKNKQGLFAILLLVSIFGCSQSKNSTPSGAASTAKPSGNDPVAQGSPSGNSSGTPSSTKATGNEAPSSKSTDTEATTQTGHASVGNSAPVPQRTNSPPPSTSPRPNAVDEHISKSTNFIQIPAGKFQRRGVAISLTQNYEMAAADVTQSLWVSMMGSNPSTMQTQSDCPKSYRKINNIDTCADYPVNNITWESAKKFISVYNQNVNDGYTYRLPTYFEWLYAAHAGQVSSVFWNTSDPQNVYDYAWVGISGQWKKAFTSVATKLPNPWGLYDVYGNVDQYVEDESMIYAEDEGMVTSMDKGNVGYALLSSKSMTDPLLLPDSSNDSLEGGLRAGAHRFVVGTCAPIEISHIKNTDGTFDGAISEDSSFEDVYSWETVGGYSDFTSSCAGLRLAREHSPLKLSDLTNVLYEVPPSDRYSYIHAIVTGIDSPKALKVRLIAGGALEKSGVTVPYDESSNAFLSNNLKITLSPDLKKLSITRTNDFGTKTFNMQLVGSRSGI